MRFKGILIDLDHTLYSYDDAHRGALSAALDLAKKKWNLPISDIESAYFQARSEIHHRLSGTAASHNRLLYFQRLCEILKKNPLPLAYYLSQKYWDVFLDNMEVYPGCVHFLQCALEQGLSIAIVTDLTAEIQFRKLEKLGINFVTLVTSEEAGREKPHPDPFQLALEKLGLAPNEVCMIGDSLSKDCNGALSLGITPYHFCLTPGQIMPEGIISVSDFYALKDLLIC